MKIRLITLAYAPARILLTTIDKVMETIGPLSFEWHMLNNHYPCWDGEIRNDVLVEKIARTYGIQLCDLGENVGLSAGYNHLVRESRANPEDIFIGIDPDVYPVTFGWGQALVDVASHEKIGWASLTFDVVDQEIKERGADKMEIGGRAVFLPRQTCMSSICAFRQNTWEKIGGIQEPKKFYGGAEGATNPKLVGMGLRWAYLKDFRESSSPLVKSEDLYQQYKWHYAHTGLIPRDKDFSAWRKENERK